MESEVMKALNGWRGERWGTTNTLHIQRIEIWIQVGMALIGFKGRKNP